MNFVKMGKGEFQIFANFLVTFSNKILRNFENFASFKMGGLLKWDCVRQHFPNYFKAKPVRFRLFV